MTKDSAKLIHALFTLYTSLYKQKYNSNITINRHKEKWAMQDVLESVGYDRTRELMVYYFDCNKPGHPLQWFFFNFDKLDDMLTKVEEDKIRRAKMREETRKMVEAEGEG